MTREDINNALDWADGKGPPIHGCVTDGYYSQLKIVASALRTAWDRIEKLEGKTNYCSECESKSAKIAQQEVQIKDFDIIAEKCLDPEYMKSMTERVIVVATIRQLKEAKTKIEQLEARCAEKDAALVLADEVIGALPIKSEFFSGEEQRQAYAVLRATKKALSSDGSALLKRLAALENVAMNAKKLIDSDGWATGKTLDELIAAFAALDALPKEK